MRKIALGLLAAATLAPGTASAGLLLGAGTGLTRTGGSIAAGDAMKDAAAWMIPLQLEAGWKFAERLTVVAFFDMNFGIVSGNFATSCNASGDSCLVNQSRVGAQVRWNFLPERRLDPWVGAGAAWEVLGIERTSATSGTTRNLHGLGFDLAAGFDWWLTQRLAVSPYLGLSVGTYKDWEDLSTFTGWQAIPSSDRRVHSQLTAGARIAWHFGATPRATAPASVPTASP